MACKPWIIRDPNPTPGLTQNINWVDVLISRQSDYIVRAT